MANGIAQFSRHHSSICIGVHLDELDAVQTDSSFLGLLHISRSLLGTRSVSYPGVRGILLVAIPDMVVIIALIWWSLLSSHRRDLCSPTSHVID